MLVLISDIHFQDIEHDLKDEDGNPVIDHNVNANAFKTFFNVVAEQFYDNFAKLKNKAELIIVLNGDIFDFLRTERWFKTSIRPYLDLGDKNDEWNTNIELDKIMIDIFNSIAGSKDKSLNTSKCLQYCKDFLKDKTRKENLKISAAASEFLTNKVRYEYIPGNHDRFVNVFRGLNKAVRKHFNIKNSQGNTGEEKFLWELPFHEYKVLARHGHLYDWQNCENNYVFRRNRNKKKQDPRLYLNTPLGDWITTDIMSRIAHEFRKIRKLDSNAPTKNDLFVYKKLKELDDLRPISAAMEWFLTELDQKNEDSDYDEMEVIKDSIKNMLTSAFYGDGKVFFKRWDKAHDRKFWPDRSDIYGNLVKHMGKSFLSLPDRLLQKIMNSLSLEESGDPAIRQIFEYENETFIQNNEFNYIVAGHSHTYSNNFLSKNKGQEKLYICTGTWRKKHFHSYDKSGFNSMKSMNFVRFLSDKEVKFKGGSQVSRVNIWNGLLGPC